MPFEYRDRPGCLHYLPPAAVSTRYYALHDPNVYLHECDKPTSVPSVPHDRLPHIPSPQSSDVHSDIHSFYASPSEVDVRMTFSEMITSASLPPSASQEFSAPFVPVAYGQPDLPKQRRNRDDPGGDTGLLAQPTALQCEVVPIPLCLGEPGQLYSSCVMHSTGSDGPHARVPDAGEHADTLPSRSNAAPA